MSQKFLDVLTVLQGTMSIPFWALYILVALELALIGLTLFLFLRYRKFLGYTIRNARRNLVRSFLTVGSIAISLFLMMTLFSLLAMISEAATKVRDSNRLITLSSQGFAQPVPIATVNQIRTLPGVASASPLAWFGGNYNEEQMPFAQFGIDAESIFTIYDEFTLPPEQLDAFQKDRAGTCIGRKLAEDRNLKVGDPLPLKGTIYPFDLNLTIRAIYDGPEDSDLRSCWFHWDYLDEGLKGDFEGRGSGNAGAVVIRCSDGNQLAALSKQIDAMTLNTDTPTRTQTEEAFVKIFLEMYGDIRGLIGRIGLAVVFSLTASPATPWPWRCANGPPRSPSSRPSASRNLWSSALFSPRPSSSPAIGGLVGAIGTKLFFDQVDISRYLSQFVAAFYVPWPVAIFGMGVALLVGFLSGIFPAARAARLSIIDGLRKVG